MYGIVAHGPTTKYLMILTFFYRWGILPRGERSCYLFRPVSRLSRHLNALRRGFHMPFGLVFILIVIPGDSPNFWSFLGPIGMEGTLLLWWGATGSSDQRNCPLLPASQVLRHPGVSSEIQLLCCKRLLGAFLGPHGKHIAPAVECHC